MLLNLNKKYSVSTKLGTITQERVLVTGILTYSELKSVPYNTTVLAIDEKIITNDGSIEEYLIDKIFYKCQLIGSPDQYIVVWDDIINIDKTNLLDTKYKYSLDITIPASVSVPITTIMTNIESYISRTFSEGIIFNANAVSGDEITKINQLEADLEKCRVILNDVTKLGPVLSMVKSINEGSIKESIDSIKSNVKSIDKNLKIVEAGM